jgi:hypothetical protein
VACPLGAAAERAEGSEREGGEGDLVGFVESDSEVPLSGELEEGESAEVEQAQVRGFLPPLQHEVADRDEQLCHIATPAPREREEGETEDRGRDRDEGGDEEEEVGSPQHEWHKLWHLFQTLPEQHHELLLDADPGDGVGEVGGLALVHIVEQAREASEEEVQLIW